MVYVPVFAGPLEGWTVNYCRQHYWRVKRSLPWEDLMQEAQLVFLRCKAKYWYVEEPKHFMALFKTAWTHQFTSFSVADSDGRFITSGAEDDEQAPDGVGELTNDGELAVMLRQAPREVLMVLNLLLSAPTEIMDIALSSWNGQDARCKTGGSERICKMLGLPANLDVMQMVVDYFRPPKQG